MADIRSDPYQERFLTEVRKVLHHLYDPAVLQRSPLGALLGLGQQGSLHAALRRVVIEAIQALKPEPTVPPHASAWRVYHILLYRYVEQSDQRTVAHNLGLSIRQLRRQERLAERLLADYLWKRYNPGERVAPAQEIKPTVFTGSDNRSPGQEEEFVWLERSMPSETVNAWEFIRDVMRTAAPMLRERGVSVTWQELADSPLLTARPSVLRQALLNLLIILARAVPGGELSIALEALASRLHICFLAKGGLDVPRLDRGALREGLQMTRRLLQIAGGELEVSVKPGADEAIEATVVLMGDMSGRQATVLVVDDNADALLLFERYLSGTRYRFVGVRDPEQVLPVAAEVSPQIIVLDVMLPGVDGWELLGRLREHPLTCRVPVVVCTILPQEDLARVLGAAAFIRKPVSREGFLATLDQQLAALGPGC